jgi:hypothetical protein
MIPPLHKSETISPGTVDETEKAPSMLFKIHSSPSSKRGAPASARRGGSNRPSEVTDGIEQSK